MDAERRPINVFVGGIMITAVRNATAVVLLIEVDPDRETAGAVF